MQDHAREDGNRDECLNVCEYRAGNHEGSEILMQKGAGVAFEMTEGYHNFLVIPCTEKSVVSLFGNR